MSNVSIYEKNWIDLVFEDKNKAYGAYQLRQENPRITLFAFFGGILFLFSLLSIGILLTSIDKMSTDVPLIPIDDPITPVNLGQLPEPKPKHSQPSHPSPAEPTPNLSHLVVAATPLAVDVPTNDNFTTNQNTTPGVGSDIPSKGNEGPAVTVALPIIEKGPVSPSELDRLPEYPGGIKKFYEYVGNNFEKPDVGESMDAISVIMSFVIEKDGSMSSIKVLRSSDKNMEREAIRVLKSLRIKWSPGYKDGDKMRTLYTLPIKVAL
ncbi:energy transducer TonB [Flavobacterium sp.]|uniref:energy transducer TonB n=1 Tax=Flavobacterium sp. TaxID=239 RepID=UPI0025D9EBCB|nr:energy transducer TonB [Flavobacterium sp.]